MTNELFEELIKDDSLTSYINETQEKAVKVGSSRPKETFILLPFNLNRKPIKSDSRNQTKNLSNPAEKKIKLPFLSSGVNPNSKSSSSSGKESSHLSDFDEEKIKLPSLSPGKNRKSQPISGSGEESTNLPALEEEKTKIKLPSLSPSKNRKSQPISGSGEKLTSLSDLDEEKIKLPFLNSSGENRKSPPGEELTNLPDLDEGTEIKLQFNLRPSPKGHT